VVKNKVPNRTSTLFFFWILCDLEIEILHVKTEFKESFLSINKIIF
jgi:hypothetical protein